MAPYERETAGSGMDQTCRHGSSANAGECKLAVEVHDYEYASDLSSRQLQELPMELPKRSKGSRTLGCAGGLWSSQSDSKGIVTRLHEKIKRSKASKLFQRRGKTEGAIPQLEEVNTRRKEFYGSNSQPSSPASQAPSTPSCATSQSPSSTASPHMPGLDSDSPSPVSVLQPLSRSSALAYSQSPKPRLSGSRLDCVQPFRGLDRASSPPLQRAAMSPTRAWQSVKRSIAPSQHHPPEKPLAPPKKLPPAALAAALASRRSLSVDFSGLPAHWLHEGASASERRRATLSGPLDYHVTVALGNDAVAEWQALMAEASGSQEELVPPVSLARRSAVHKPSTLRPEHLEASLPLSGSNDGSPGTDHQPVNPESSASATPTSPDEEVKGIDSPASAKEATSALADVTPDRRLAKTAAKSMGRGRVGSQEWREVSCFLGGTSSATALATPPVTEGSRAGVEVPVGALPVVEEEVSPSGAAGGAEKDPFPPSVDGDSSEGSGADDKFEVVEGGGLFRQKGAVALRVVVPEPPKELEEVTGLSKATAIPSPPTNGGWDSEMREDFPTAACAFSGGSHSRPPLAISRLWSHSATPPPSQASPPPQPPSLDDSDMYERLASLRRALRITRAQYSGVSANENKPVVEDSASKEESHHIAEGVLRKLRPDLDSESPPQSNSVVEGRNSSLVLRYMRPDLAGACALHKAKPFWA